MPRIVEEQLGQHTCADDASRTEKEKIELVMDYKNNQESCCFDSEHSSIQTPIFFALNECKSILLFSDPKRSCFGDQWVRR